MTDEYQPILNRHDDMHLILGEFLMRDTLCEGSYEQQKRIFVTATLIRIHWY